MRPNIDRLVVELEEGPHGYLPSIIVDTVSCLDMRIVLVVAGSLLSPPYEWSLIFSSTATAMVEGR